MRTEHGRVCRLAAEYRRSRRAILQCVLFAAALTRPAAQRAKAYWWQLMGGVVGGMRGVVTAGGRWRARNREVPYIADLAAMSGSRTSPTG